MAYKRKTDQPKKDHYSDTAKEIADIFIKALEEETLPWQLDDEVKVVGFNNDSDLTVLNSPTQSHKSPDIER